MLSAALDDSTLSAMLIGLDSSTLDGSLISVLNGLGGQNLHVAFRNIPCQQRSSDCQLIWGRAGGGDTKQSTKRLRTVDIPSPDFMSADSYTMSAASYDSAHMGEGVEYHTVYGVSPWITRTYLLPYSGTGMLYRTVS